MEDKLLIDGLFARDERSVARLEEKYSGYCYTVAYAVVRCREDAQECVGDAMLGAWNSIPPNRPENLGAYVGRIARNSALNMLKARRFKNPVLCVTSDYDINGGESAEYRVYDGSADGIENGAFAREKIKK